VAKARASKARAAANPKMIGNMVCNLLTTIVDEILVIANILVNSFV
jgi:uncharacterized protein YejL (UPF0352 family)